MAIAGLLVPERRKVPRTDRSSFVLVDSARASSKDRNTLTASKKKPEEVSSSSAPAHPTPRSISGEQFISPPAPSSPRSYSPTSSPANDTKLPAQAARRVLQRLMEIQIARSTWNRWLQAGTIPAEKIAGRWHVRFSAIERFAQEARW
jgi:hypothetical protein